MKVTVQFETEGNGQNEIVSNMDRSEVKLLINEKNIVVSHIQNEILKQKNLTESEFEGAPKLLRWFETVFHFPFQLNFMKGLLVCSKRLLLLVDSRCCNNLSIYQLLCSH